MKYFTTVVLSTFIGSKRTLDASAVRRDGDDACALAVWELGQSSVSEWEFRPSP
jgi:hypothetical protein